MVLPKVLKKLNSSRELNQKGFLRNTVPDETKGSHSQFFFRHCETFFRKKNPHRVPLHFLRQNGCGKIQKGPPFQFFGIERLFIFFGCCRREYFDTLKSLIMAPTWAGPGLFLGGQAYSLQTRVFRPLATGHNSRKRGWQVSKCAIVSHQNCHR